MSKATPFRKVLVANRGEIALRVMRSARAAGYRTVAVYSSADARSRHVLEADQATAIGGPQPHESYLNIGAIVDAARRTGADAVHPGYGFLAENADFAQACLDAGLVFVGPSPQAIRAMGHKAGAKRLMLAAGVPCVPGYQGEDQSAARLAEEAARIGWPVMVKAVAGGGGRGMRVVRSAADFADALAAARREALNAFGDDAVILERALEDPRHIEIQVFADRHGNALHLGERDCSVQRRHQKLIEEAPSPAVSAELRERMGAVAVQAVKAIGYEGAGTLEFLLDGDGRFYFMEMNTRLQVEHPVTEAVTGLDLVALQLQVAAGEPLPLTQAQLHWQGHAIEVRLCAEDAAQGFVPQSGRMLLWQPPEGLRVEHALHSGADVPPHYDSMVAKLVAQGRTRDEARRRLACALHDLVALGPTTNQLFLRRCLEHPVFVDGAATTAFVGRHGHELQVTDPMALGRATAVAALMLLLTDAAVQRGGHGAAMPRIGHGAAPPRSVQQGLRHGLPTGLRFSVDGQAQQATVTELGPQRHRVHIGGRGHEVELLSLNAQQAHVACDGVLDRLAWVRQGAQLLLHLDGLPLRVQDLSRELVRRGAMACGDGRLRASTAGRVVAVRVVVGEQVQPGQPLLTLEAMKMEHVHAAPVAGLVRALHAAVGDQVSAGLVLAEIEAGLATG